MTTRRPRRKPDKDIFWREYEKQITQLLATLDPNASVRHNASIIGGISGVPRQIDALAEGVIVGQKMRVVAEAKCHARKVTIEMIDGFVGKLLDLGAERGIFYSSAGFSEGAISRAEQQRNPHIGLVRLHATPAPEFHDTTAYMTPGRTTENLYRIEHSWPLNDGTPLAAGPVVETYEEFLRGEGFLYLEE
ncbi:restriction endonuclease [Streptomyces sp. NPDC008092]|uniref:restriction endonuclease n=1 Tax=Streptomyces sp. NPDC008092 TaxID=3364808 RepID=UPI0036EECE0E